MPRNEIYALPNIVSPANPVIYHPEVCNGCNRCVDVCVMDVFVENKERGKPPNVAYPEECWFDGCCVEMCPQKDALKVQLGGKTVFSSRNWLETKRIEK